MKALAVSNSNSTEVWKYTELLVPYLEHFGVPYESLDLGITAFSADRQHPPLIILSHTDILSGLDKSAAGVEIVGRIGNMIKLGSGLVCFDQLFPLPGISTVGVSDGSAGPNATRTSRLQFGEKPHYIIQNREPGEELMLFGPLVLHAETSPDEEVLIRGNAHTLLGVINTSGGRIVRWTSMDWMLSSVLGPMGGLDGCLWRSFVWAAAKPFVLRCLPPIVTMRVDDVAGQGHIFEKPPLYWVETAIRYGFKPWLGLFIYNLRPKAVDDVRSFVTARNADAFPHAFGRPPRNKRTAEFYYHPQALPPRSKVYDEFIYYDHNENRNWSDEEALRGFKAVDEWYDRHGPLPKSTYILPHWYEISTNTLPYVTDVWKCEFIGLCKDPDLPLAGGTPWLKSGPFRLYEKPGEAERGKGPVYYADFVTLADKTLFNTITEIRDDAGYEWAPDNDAAASIGRGVRQLRRALDSLAHAVLFTHETDYIYRIEPDKWEEEIRRVREGIDDYDPIMMTSDEAVKVLRAFRTSRIEEYTVDPCTGMVGAAFSGTADMATSFTVFTEKGGDVKAERFEVPAFTSKARVSTKE